MLKDTSPEGREELLNSLRGNRRSLRDDGSFDVNVDLMMEAEPKGEGNDASGYRETRTAPGWKKRTVYIVKEDGKYKVLCRAEEPSAVGLEVLDRVAAHDLESARVLLDWVREEQHLEGGDDPLSGHAFPRIWTKGKDADAGQMKLAAAALLVQTKPATTEGVFLMEEAKKLAGSDQERTNINLALLSGDTNLEDYEKLLAVSSELAKQYPESRRVFLSESRALRALGRFDEANSLAQQRLKRIPDDVDALRTLVENAVAREDYRAAYEISQKIVDAGKAEASDLNGRAWLTLFFERAEGPDIETAIKASQLDQNDYHTLHTLGCLYAVAGKTKEAREVLLQAMNLQHLDEPNPDYWYAFGLIAEQYGERNVATADYAKVTKPKRPLQIPESSYRLAQNRLKILQSTPSPSVTSMKR